MKSYFCHSGEWDLEDLVEVKVPWFDHNMKRIVDNWKICDECWKGVLFEGELTDIEDFIPKR